MIQISEVRERWEELIEIKTLGETSRMRQR
jgi:hypothetical protein